MWWSCGSSSIRAWHSACSAANSCFLIVATSAALLLVAYWLFSRSRNNRLQQAALILVLGGGIGNLIDRVLNGEVVDYIKAHDNAGPTDHEVGIR